MHEARWLTCLATLLLVSASIVGCKKSSANATVHGKVAYHGAPIERGSLTFFPAVGRAIPASISAGQYSIELPPGDYVVTVDIANELPPGFKEGDPVPQAKVLLPEQYSNRANSPLKTSVADGSDHPVDFDLK